MNISEVFSRLFSGGPKIVAATKGSVRQKGHTPHLVRREPSQRRARTRVFVWWSAEGAAGCPSAGGYPRMPIFNSACESGIPVYLGTVNMYESATCTTVMLVDNP